MEAAAVGAALASRDDSFARQPAPIAFLVIVRKGPTWSPTDLEPLCRLLSKRFTGEIWAFGSYDADIRVERFRVRVVNDERSSSHIGRLALTTRQMLRWAGELRAARVADLVVIALEPFNGGLLGLYVARRSRGSLICEVNGVYADRNNFASGGIPVWLRVAARRVLGAFVLSRATAVRLLFAEQLQRFVRLPPRVLTRQFFDFTPIERFNPGVEEKMILSVGFPFRVKGFDILCRAFLAIANEHADWKLVLIGHLVPEELLAAGLEHPQIEAHPGVKQRELAEWMSRCAIFALPSRTEAMGHVLIEDGVDGLLVEKENVDELSAALARLIADAPLRHRLGDAARVRAGREFSGNAYLEHYAEFVSSALARRRL